MAEIVILPRTLLYLNPDNGAGVYWDRREGLADQGTGWRLGSDHRSRAAARTAHPRSVDPVRSTSDPGGSRPRRWYVTAGCTLMARACGALARYPPRRGGATRSRSCQMISENPGGGSDGRHGLGRGTAGVRRRRLPQPRRQPAAPGRLAATGMVGHPSLVARRRGGGVHRHAVRRKGGSCSPIATGGDDEEWQDVEEPVPIVWTPCHFGGSRPWFVCPGIVNGVPCGRRVGKLYGPGRYFLCRHCYRLAYQSQREQPHERALRRANSIRMRLGGEPGMLCPFPEKPKGMHWRTYERLRQRVRDAEMVAEERLWVQLGRIKTRPRQAERKLGSLTARSAGRPTVEGLLVMSSSSVDTRRRPRPRATSGAGSTPFGTASSRGTWCCPGRIGASTTTCWRAWSPSTPIRTDRAPPGRGAGGHHVAQAAARHGRDGRLPGRAGTRARRGPWERRTGPGQGPGAPRWGRSPPRPRQPRSARRPRTPTPSFGTSTETGDDGAGAGDPPKGQVRTPTRRRWPSCTRTHGGGGRRSPRDAEDRG